MRTGVKLMTYGIGAAALLAIAGMAAWIIYVNNVEKPAYQTLRADGDVELRRYPPLLVAEVTRSGSRKQAVNAGFRPLANYIFAKERDDAGIAMTAPVTQRQREAIAMTAPVTQLQMGGQDDMAADEWIVRFIMPSKYTAETLPKPVQNDVRIVELAESLTATIRFSGHADDEAIAANEARLRTWIEDHDLETISPATYAYYNDPWTPGPFRRNEVLLEVIEGTNVQAGPYRL